MFILDQSVMFVVFAKKEAMVLIAAQMTAHDQCQQINHLVDLFLTHAGYQAGEKLVFTELTQECDERLFIGGAVKSKKHSLTLPEISTRPFDLADRQTHRKKYVAMYRVVIVRPPEAP